MRFGGAGLSVRKRSASIANAHASLQPMHKHSRVHLPISHIVDSIGGCEGLREHLKEVEDIVHRDVLHLEEETHTELTDIHTHRN